MAFINSLEIRIQIVANGTFAMLRDGVVIEIFTTKEEAERAAGIEGDLIEGWQ